MGSVGNAMPPVPPLQIWIHKLSLLWQEARDVTGVRQSTVARHIKMRAPHMTSQLDISTEATKYIQRSAKVLVRGLVKFVPALA